MAHYLHTLALSRAKNYKRSESELIDVLCQIDKSKMYLQYEVRSLSAYCVKYLGLSECEAGRFVNVTRTSYRVPELKKAISEGVLTVSKAARITSVITPSTQEEWIGKAKELTHRKLEKEVVKVNPRAVSPERIQSKTPEISELRVNISPELEKKLRRAQEVLRASTLEETLEKLTDLALKHKDPVEKAQRLHRKQSQTPARLQTTPKTLHVQSNPHHHMPANIRHQVNLRDEGKCFYCKSNQWTEIHHQIPLSKGGKHEVENLITLCSAHHSMLHHFQRSKYKSPTKKLPWMRDNRIGKNPLDPILK